MTIGKHDGLDVLGVDVKLVRAGDGLSEPMKVDPVELRHGERVFLIGVATCIDEQYPFASKRRDALRRKYVLEANELHLVAEAEIGGLLAERHEKVQAGIASMKGQEALGDDDEEDEI